MSIECGDRGTLYIVATPIGNLGDISARMEQTLRDVDFIAAEDTRVTRKMLERLDIKKPLVSYYEHNSRESGEKILGRVISGENCALVTDAGTPGISDPGEGLVRLCIGAGIPILIIPGPCAAVSALTLSGLPAGRFTFEGFLSTARKSRSRRLTELKAEKRTMVFYEAPHKLMRTLNDMLAAFGDRNISISRELTKVFEETIRCKLSEAITHFELTPPRGEFTLVIEGADDAPPAEQTLDEAISAAESYIQGGMSVKDAVKKASDEFGAPKNTLYNSMIKQQPDGASAPSGRSIK